MNSTRDGKTPRRGTRSRRPGASTVLVLAVIFLAIASLAPSAQQLIAQRQQIAALEASVQETQDRIDALALEQSRWSDPAYILAQARGRLLFVMPGDTSYLVVDSAPAGASAPTQHPTTSLEQTQSDWTITFAKSLFVAGTTNEAGTPPAEGQ